MSDPIAITNWLRIDEKLTTSGQPSEAQLAEIRDLGVRYVVNLGLHTHEKALPDEAASVAALGMTYIHIPVEFDAPTDDHYVRFLGVLEEIGDAPVHVHCIVNARVSAFVYRYRRDVLGVSEQDARPALEAIWQPGGVWAAFMDDNARVDLPHRYRPIA